ncbi:hypothetical protein [Desertihabitans brevis]|uniref:hypothetical protein n=1 Tax=Desertihabitans brevis TaxID=2268447 RepID=UPI0011BDC805|nr:hypothetical protein [Desertihabitans brevis]
MPNTVPTRVPSGPRPASGARRGPRRWSRAVAAGVLALGLATGVSACGFGAQTLQPYTPAAGVNVDVPEDARMPLVNVRDLRIISQAEGSGFLSATLVASDVDQLVSVSGQTFGPDGQPTGPLGIELAQPVDLGPAQNPLVLADQQPRLAATGDGVVPGLTAEVTLTFASAGEATLTIPITNAEDLTG